MKITIRRYNDTTSLNTTVSNLNTSVSNTITTVTNLASSVAAISTATGGESHSAVGRPPRMKNLGTISNATDANNFVTTHKIDTGKFEDIELGDYITLTHSKMPNNSTATQWWIAGLDWRFEPLNNSSTSGYGANRNLQIVDYSSSHRGVHHIALFPKTSLLSTCISSTFTNNSVNWISSPLEQYLNDTLINIFPYGYRDYILNQFIKIDNISMSTGSYSMAGAGFTGYQNKVHQGSTSSYSYQLRKINLLSEYEILGTSGFGASFNEYDDTRYGILPLFKIMPYTYWGTVGTWTRTISSFSIVYGSETSGNAKYNTNFLCVGGNQFGQNTIDLQLTSNPVRPIIFFGKPIYV